MLRRKKNKEDYSLKKRGAVCNWLLGVILTVAPVVVNNISCWLRIGNRPINQIFSEMTGVVFAVAGSLTILCFQVNRKRGGFLSYLKYISMGIMIIVWTTFCLGEDITFNASESLIKKLLFGVFILIVILSIVGAIISEICMLSENKTIKEMHVNCKNIMNKNYLDEEKVVLTEEAQCEYTLLCYPECYERAEKNLNIYIRGQGRKEEDHE